jgi:leucyl-tRNA synthetase
MKYNFKTIENKWQKKWKEKKVFQVKEDKKKSKFYCLEMFPYPSGAGLHMGHALNYTIGDIYARFKRMKGFNVLYPMGYDSFGLPAENAAIKAKEHPKKYTNNSIKNFINQQRLLGLSYDWSKMIQTSDKEYYLWNQFFFLKFLEKGLVYRKKAPVNWCSKCNTVLANEQVHNGKCWRHSDIEVKTKHLEQWFIKTTDYAEELLDCIDDLKWPDRIKTMQKNWIGKSHGTEIKFEIENTNNKLNFILLHGYTARAEGGFRQWLSKELESRGHKVFVPNLPNTDNPLVKEQVDYVLKNYKFDKNTVLLGHSLGSVVALKVVEKLKRPIKKLILASAFSNPKFKKQIGFEKGFDWKFNFKKVKANAKEIIILRDISDEGISDEQTGELLSELNCKIIKFKAEVPHIRGKQEPEVLNACLEKWPIFTTRPDTIYGVTFMVVSAQHTKLMELVTPEQKKDVEKFLKKIKSVPAPKGVPSEEGKKDAEDLEKEGVFTGSYAINPLTKEKVPVYAGNFVIADYGSGMVMAVPAHDQRDFAFAKKYNIEIKQVIGPTDFEWDKSKAYTGEGSLINSEKFDGMNNKEAKDEITKFLSKKKLGKKVVQYKLRDWLVSRQRYWGTPIPIIYCDKCGEVPVPEKDLPVILPDKVKFGKGNPLETNKKFLNVKCPKCNAKARRETDTMDTFFDSSWYYLRYPDSKNCKNAFDKKKADYWLPVDQYIGGAEHACMHLIYARFFTKALRDLGFVKFDEPFVKLFNQGMLHGEDGNKMSKSLGNVILPETVSDKYGIDTARLFLVSIASPDKDVQWSEKGIKGSLKFINKFFDYFEDVKIGKDSSKLLHKLNFAVQKIEKNIENFKYNLAVIDLRSLFDVFYNEKEVSKFSLESFLKLLHPFCPHITEELWKKIGNKNFISLESWPIIEKKKINEGLEKQELIINAVKEDIIKIKNIVGIEKSYPRIFAIPNEVKFLEENKNFLEKTTGSPAIYIFSTKDVKDNPLIDPENKSKKARPGKPGIHIAGTSLDI